MTKNILILHGWGAETAKLKPLASDLTDLGWKTFVPEIPGFGAPPPKTAWSVSNYSTYFRKLADEKFSGKYYVFGHSFGGRVAIKMGLKAGRVSGLILCATGGLSRGSKLKRKVFGGIAKVGKPIFYVPKIGKVSQKAYYKVLREHDYEKAQGVMKQTMTNVVEEDLKPLIGKIKISTLVLWGEQDRMTPISDAHYIEKNLRGSTLKEYKDQGHQLPYIKHNNIAKEINNWAKGVDK